jgi:streptomycin 6-kinase
VSTIQVPPQLRRAVDQDGVPERYEWLAALPDRIAQLASQWGLALGDPYVPGGQCAWVAPAKNAAGDDLVLKVGWRHLEAEHEADALRLWDGDGAVRCLANQANADTAALLLERCTPGGQLKNAVPEPDQDVIVAGVLHRLWGHDPPPGHPFRSLEAMCDEWATACERDPHGFDPGLVRAGIEILRELPRTAERRVLLSTDLHAGNVLSARRESWLAIDPKPFVGDPAFDPVQHMLNCDERLAADPQRLARRMAGLLELDPQRVTLWLFARCAQEAPNDPSKREPALRLAP